MRTKLLLVGAAVVTVLGAGAAIAWGASSQPAPAAWSHSIAAGPSQPGAAMRAMHRGLDRAQLDRIAEICEQAMETGGMMDDRDMTGDAGMMDDADAGMMDDGDMMGDAGMMDDDDMMGGNGGGMMDGGGR